MWCNVCGPLSECGFVKRQMQIRSNMVAHLKQKSTLLHTHSLSAGFRTDRGLIIGTGKGNMSTGADVIDRFARRKPQGRVVGPAWLHHVCVCVCVCVCVRTLMWTRDDSRCGEPLKHMEWTWDVVVVVRNIGHGRRLRLGYYIWVATFGTCASLCGRVCHLGHGDFFPSSGARKNTWKKNCCSALPRLR